MNLYKKTVLITGASDGIGKNIAITFAQENVKLILFGRDKNKLESVKNDCKSEDIQIYSFDINDRKEMNKILDEILINEQIDVLINNAGIWHKLSDLDTLSEEKINEVINTNLISPMLLTRKLLPSMKNRETIILNIISKSGLIAQKGQSVYTASKYGMKGFTDVLREDTKEDPIRIGAIYQAGTNTQMFSKAGDIFETERFTNPKDLSEVILFMVKQPKKIWLNEIHVTY